MSRSIDDIIDTLRSKGIQCTPVPHNSYTLTHSLTNDEFDVVIKDVVQQHNLKPQNKDWFPGTCTGNLDDYGYYVCPVVYDEYDEGDFDMCIMTDAIYFC